MKTNTHGFLSHLPHTHTHTHTHVLFLKEIIKSLKIGYREQFLKKPMGKPKGEGKGNAKVLFLFIFSLFTIMITDTACRKFSFRKIFSKKWSLVPQSIGHII